MAETNNDDTSTMHGHTDAATPQQTQKISRHAQDIVDHWRLNRTLRGGSVTFTICVTAYKNGARLVLQDGDPERWTERHAEEWFEQNRQASAAEHAATMIARLLERALAEAAHLPAPLATPALPTAEN